MAKFHPDLPVPVRTRTVTIAIPNSQNKPGKNSQKDTNQIELSCLFPHPAEKNEKDQTGVKSKKEFIEKSIHFEIQLFPVPYPSLYL